MADEQAPRCRSLGSSRSARRAPRSLPATIPPRARRAAAPPDAARARARSRPTASRRTRGSTRSRPGHRDSRRSASSSIASARKRASSRPTPGSPMRPASERSAVAAREPDLDVVDDRHRSEELRRLKRPRDPDARDPMRRESGDVAFSERESIRSWAGRTRDSTLSSVVFPAPLGPMSPWTVPGSSVRSTPASAPMPPKRMSTLSATTRARRAAAGRRPAGVGGPPGAG